jgi:hypothetical protein
MARIWRLWFFVTVLVLWWVLSADSTSTISLRTVALLPKWKYTVCTATPAEAAMETSLTVREADGMLSELAGGGHLSVESAGGTLCYSLPGRQATELDEPSSAT